MTTEESFPPAGMNESIYYPLWEHLVQQHDIMLLDSELQEIIRIACAIQQQEPNP
jgi:hypothetical protein